MEYLFLDDAEIYAQFGHFIGIDCHNQLGFRAQVNHAKPKFKFMIFQTRRKLDGIENIRLEHGKIQQSQIGIEKCQSITQNGMNKSKEFGDE